MVRTDKAVVVGGSNGIGLAITKTLIESGYFVEILDICQPDGALLPDEGYKYSYCDMRFFSESALRALSEDEGVKALVITAGLGRVSELEYLHISEVEKTMTVNALSVIKTIDVFYNRIKSADTFYCAVMGSIAGWVSSPAFSVYAASKAAVCRFTESVNVELEMAGVSNRILNVSPGSIKGTRFNGGENDISQTAALADEIVRRMFDRQCLYIPEYEEIYKGVIERYNADPEEYGRHSYSYKKDSGRLINEKKVRIGYISGTYDLFHIGHLNILRRAKSQCDYLIVGVHDSGAWKGKETFVPLEERKAIVAACRYVDKVVDSCREDCDAWSLYHYNVLFVGSDYKGTERFKRYEEYFKDKNVDIVYFPYTKTTSSTQIRKAVLMHTGDGREYGEKDNE
ncbi:MAG: SDR family NAD(P)-dependent oxidoreductase [Oscillospiraceae bacterium]|nr:SDR family NAD(P)-dependent oxidoreductase [Oscillospiraceae bacterium]